MISDDPCTTECDSGDWSSRVEQEHLPAVKQEPHDVCTTPPSFSTFKPATESEISKILHNFPNKQCDSDPIPTWLLKK